VGGPGLGRLTRLAVCFTAPRTVAVLEETLDSPGPGELLVETLVSAISAGSELLVYRGLLPAGLPLDATLPALAGDGTYPLRYGYAAVGRVCEVGAELEPAWLGRLVFAFHPHASAFAVAASEVIAIPDGLAPDAAALLPTLETAVNLLLDGQPAIGERVVVYGQGVVGLATTALLAALPLAALVALDRHPLRRATALALGAGASLDPSAEDTPARLAALLGDGPAPAGADLVYELSGNPAALDAAIETSGYGGRVVVGSWYGREPAALHLGGSFHRGRTRLSSSQVSTLAPEHTGRWTRARRLHTALAALSRLPAERLITHRLPLARAAEAYALLDEHPERTLQVLLVHRADGSAGAH
jgi:2-desacetyl-2-hydroxyethyl bacteriochlorophyllide A dehydrogenase